MDETTYTIRDVAKILKVSQDTVRRAIRAGEITAAKIGRQWRITPRDLESYLQSKGSLGLGYEDLAEAT